jgi:hypothetical protein
MSNYTNQQWRTHRGSATDQNSAGNGNGGSVESFIASGTLLVGDAVYLSADNTVTKAAVAANYVKFVGIVVGGDSLNGFIAQDRDLQSATQLTAALNGKNVIVQVSGIARVISDAALTTGAVTGGAVTAGRVSNTGATAGQIIGTILAAVAGAALNTRMLIAPR